MPDSKTVYDSTGRQVQLDSESSDERRAREARATVRTSAAGLGSLARKGFTPSAQRPDEDASAYGQRIARERAAWTQRQAMK